MTYYSQGGQDQYLDLSVFCGFERGVFVDVGAWDGVEINNTLFFEKNRRWTGINIEPTPSTYARLQHNRPQCINLDVAVTDTEGQTEFVCSTGSTACISGIKSNYDPRHLKRLERENEQLGTVKSIIQVQTRRLDSIFRDHAVNHVHYLSVDVEGSEFNVLKSINFNEVFIDVIGFENNFPENSIPIVQFLEGQGYVALKQQGDDIFMIHKKSAFFTNVRPRSFPRLI